MFNSNILNAMKKPVFQKANPNSIVELYWITKKPDNKFQHSTLVDPGEASVKKTSGSYISNWKISIRIGSLNSYSRFWYELQKRGIFSPNKELQNNFINITRLLILLLVKFPNTCSMVYWSQTINVHQGSHQIDSDKKENRMNETISLK